MARVIHEDTSVDRVLRGGIEFDADLHAYSRDGERKPATSDITRLVSTFPQNGRKTPQMHFGTAFHLTTDLYDHDDLDEESLADELAACLAQYKAWLEAHEVAWFGVESICYQEAYGYAGTIDRWGVVDGVKTLVDIKTGKKIYDESCRLQTAAYQMLLWPHVGPHQRAILLIQPDRFEWRTYPEVDDLEDWEAFKALLQFYRWRNR